MHFSRFIFFSTAIATFLCLASSPSRSTPIDVLTVAVDASPGVQEMSLEQQGIGLAPSSQICDFERVTISKSGKYGVFWRREPDIRLGTRGSETGDAVLVNLDCLHRRRDFGACRAAHIESLGAISAPMFSADEHQISVSDARLGLVTHGLKFDDQGVVVIPSQGHELSGSQVSILKFSGVKPDFNEKYLDDIKNSLGAMTKLRDLDLRMLRISLDREGVQGSLAESKSSMMVTVFDSDGKANETHIPTSFLPYASVERAMNGRILLAADGVALALNKNGSLEALPNSEGRLRRPITAAASGRVVGFFGEKTVERLDGEVISSWDDFKWIEHSIRPGQYLSDISVSAVRSGKVDKLIAIVGDLQDRRSIYLFDTNGSPTKSVLACGSPAATLPASDETINIGEADWPIWAKQYRGSGERKGLVVFMHGGPGSNGGFGAYAPTIQFYLREGYDIVIPEFSGSTGFGIEVSRRLSASGAGALERDSLLLQRFVRSKRAHYKTIIAHAESYGAVPWLWSKPDTTFDRSFLLVPLLKLRDPEVWTRDHQLGGYSPNFQKLFESTFFGAGFRRDAFRDEISRRVETNWRASKVLIIQARNDPISQFDDTAALRSGGAVLVQLNTFHAAIESEPETWRRIQNSLGSQIHSPPAH